MESSKYIVTGVLNRVSFKDAILIRYSNESEKSVEFTLVVKQWRGYSTLQEGVYRITPIDDIEIEKSEKL